MKLLILQIVFLFCFIFELTHTTRSEDFEPVLRLSSGFIKGKSVNFRGVQVYQFLGIPYAEPPLDELRFKKPVPKKPWNGVLSVNKWGTACMQPTIPGVNTDLHISEDCLILNVFTAEAAIQVQRNGNEYKLRPVMVWIHGGSFIFGSASQPSSYDGTALTAIKDVIVVSLNYRLGPLGFLHLPEAGVPGNMGLWDQQLALKWVKDNIQYFGGDPDEITIFGESAGSVSVSAQLISPQSKGLFKNVIMQSGSIYALKQFTVPNVAREFLNKIDCTYDDYKLCLANYQYGQYPEADLLTFWPIVGDRFLPNNPEELVANNGVDPNVNVLLGTVDNEGIFFLIAKDNNTFNPSNPVKLTLPHAKYIFGKLFGETLIDFYSELYLASIPADDSDAIRLAVAQALGDTVVSCSTYSFGRDLIANGVPNVYAYIQLQKPKSYGSVNQTWNSNIPSHTDDIPMVFGRPFIEPDQYNAEDAFLSFLMIDIWTKFAKKEKPPKIAYQEWLAWSPNNNIPYYAMVLDSKKLGLIETEQVEFCLENWPFPMEKPIDLLPQNLQ